MFRYYRNTAHLGPMTRRELANDLLAAFRERHNPIREMLRQRVKDTVDEERRAVMREQMGLNHADDQT